MCLSSAPIKCRDRQSSADISLDIPRILPFLYAYPRYFLNILIAPEPPPRNRRSQQGLRPRTLQTALTSSVQALLVAPASFGMILKMSGHRGWLLMDWRASEWLEECGTDFVSWQLCFRRDTHGEHHHRHHQLDGRWSEGALKTRNRPRWQFHLQARAACLCLRIQVSTQAKNVGYEYPAATSHPPGIGDGATRAATGVLSGLLAARPLRISRISSPNEGAVNNIEAAQHILKMEPERLAYQECLGLQEHPV